MPIDTRTSIPWIICDIGIVDSRCSCLKRKICAVAVVITRCRNGHWLSTFVVSIVIFELSCVTVPLTCFYNNNPVVYSDPSGYSPWCAAAIAAPFVEIGVGDALLVLGAGAAGKALTANGNRLLSDYGRLLSNPDGQKGSPAHQNGVKEAIEREEAAGNNADNGTKISTPNGAKTSRIPDVVVTDKER